MIAITITAEFCTCTLTKIMASSSNKINGKAHWEGNHIKTFGLQPH